MARTESRDRGGPLAETLARQAKLSVASLNNRRVLIDEELPVRCRPRPRHSSNAPEWVVLQYGAALAGLTLVTANPAFKASELEFVLCQPRSSIGLGVRGRRESPADADVEDWPR